MTTNYEQFAWQFARALHLSRHIPEHAEVTARRNPDGTITIAWDETIAVNQRGEILVVDGELIPAAGGSVDLVVVRGDAPTIVWGDV